MGDPEGAPRRVLHGQLRCRGRRGWRVFIILPQRLARMAQKRVELAQELAALTRDELVERVLMHEGSGEAIKRSKRARKLRNNRPFEFEAYEHQHVAMKVSYFGWDYHGFASQISFKEGSRHPFDPERVSAIPTVEEHLFRALVTAKLIEHPMKANYSRCGRTDAGVSSTGQVIGVTVRASQSKVGEGERKALPVAAIMNGLLPPAIRVLDVVPAPAGFHARFDCKYRLYHYYFARHQLDVAAMREAAGLLLGEHDFRNLCKRDPSKEVQNYRRTILESRIEACGPETGSPFDMFRYVVKGTAFLYHQVRCTMTVLLMVGQRQETPDIVSYLTGSLSDWRPTIRMASEIPLVLVECGFDSIAFAGEDPCVARNHRQFFGQWQDRMAQAKTIEALIPAAGCEQEPLYNNRLRQ